MNSAHPFPKPPTLKTEFQTPPTLQMNSAHPFPKPTHQQLKAFLQMNSAHPFPKPPTLKTEFQTPTTLQMNSAHPFPKPTHQQLKAFLSLSPPTFPSVIPPDAHIIDKMACAPTEKAFFFWSRVHSRMHSRN
jgi:hypothetical protein